MAIAMVVCDPCIDRARRKKKTDGESDRRSPKRLPSGGGRCEHGVPTNGFCTADGCWNNEKAETPRMRSLLSLTPAMIQPVKRAASLMDKAKDDDAKRERRRVRRIRKNAERDLRKALKKADSKPLTGRAPRAHDDELV